MDAPRALIVFLVVGSAGCAAAPPPPAKRTFVHPESAKDARLIEALDAAPKEKVPPGALDYAWKTPLVVPTLTILWVKDMPRALAEFASLPFALVGGLLEAVGIVKRRRDVPDPPPEKDR